MLFAVLNLLLLGLASVAIFPEVAVFAIQRQETDLKIVTMSDVDDVSEMET